MIGFWFLVRLGNVGDVEKLLKEHRENQDLVRSIGVSHYQIVFPVQLRHREKMGISTREIGATKVNKSILKSNYTGLLLFLIRLNTNDIVPTLIKYFSNNIYLA